MLDPLQPLRDPRHEAVDSLRGHLVTFVHVIDEVLRHPAGTAVYIEAFEDIQVLTNGLIELIQVKDRKRPFALTDASTCTMLNRWARAHSRVPAARFVYASTQAIGQTFDRDGTFRQWIAAVLDDGIAVDHVACIRSVLVRYLSAARDDSFSDLRKVLASMDAFRQFWSHIRWEFGPESCLESLQRVRQQLHERYSADPDDSRLSAWLGNIAISAASQELGDRCWTLARLEACKPTGPGIVNSLVTVLGLLQPAQHEKVLAILSEMRDLLAMAPVRSLMTDVNRTAPVRHPQSNPLVAIRRFARALNAAVADRQLESARGELLPLYLDADVVVHATVPLHDLLQRRADGGRPPAMEEELARVLLASGRLGVVEVLPSHALEVARVLSRASRDLSSLVSDANRRIHPPPDVAAFLDELMRLANRPQASVHAFGRYLLSMPPEHISWLLCALAVNRTTELDRVFKLRITSDWGQSDPALSMFFAVLEVVGPQDHSRSRNHFADASALTILARLLRESIDAASPVMPPRFHTTTRDLLTACRKPELAALLSSADRLRALPEGSLLDEPASVFRSTEYLIIRATFAALGRSIPSYEHHAEVNELADVARALLSAVEAVRDNSIRPELIDELMQIRFGGASLAEHIRSVRALAVVESTVLPSLSTQSLNLHVDTESIRTFVREYGAQLDAWMADAQKDELQAVRSLNRTYLALPKILQAVSGCRTVLQDGVMDPVTELGLTRWLGVVRPAEREALRECLQDLMGNDWTVSAARALAMCRTVCESSGERSSRLVLAALWGIRCQQAIAELAHGDETPSSSMTRLVVLAARGGIGGVDAKIVSEAIRQCVTDAIGLGTVAPAEAYLVAAWASIQWWQCWETNPRHRERVGIMAPRAGRWARKAAVSLAQGSPEWMFAQCARLVAETAIGTTYRHGLPEVPSELREVQGTRSSHCVDVVAHVDYRRTLADLTLSTQAKREALQASQAAVERLSPLIAEPGNQSHRIAILTALQDME